MHAVVVRSTFGDENAQNISASDHFWKLRCEKVHAAVARGTCGSEHVKNKHQRFGPLFDDSIAIDVVKVHDVVA